MGSDVCPLCGIDDDVEERVEGESGSLVSECVAHQPPQLVARRDPTPRRSQRATRSSRPSPTVQGARYECWNAAVEQVVFDGRWAHRPVYLDPDGGLIEAVAGAAGEPSDSAIACLFAAVCPTLRLPPVRGRIFEWHERRFDQWRQRREATPPMLALLLFFTSVADGMRRDEGLAATNYYSRLAEACGLDPHEHRNKVTRDFMAVSQPLWEGLNAWLDTHEGELGLPTAYAFDSRVHVGLPIAQALVRDRDRDRFPELFAALGLEPGQRVPPRDLQRLLDGEIEESPLSGSLKTLWRSGGDTRERIASVAAVELQTWDGRLPEGTEREYRVSQQLHLTARVRRSLGLRVEFGLLVRFRPELVDAELSLPDDVDAAGRAPFASDQRLRLQSAQAEGWLTIQPHAAVSVADLLVADVRLQVVDADAEIRRRPRRVVVFEYDEAHGWFREVPRIEFGRDALLLARDEVIDEVEALLEAAARPGFDRAPAGTSGVPTGWHLVRDVQLLAAPATTNLELSSLVPAATSDLGLGGGLALWGRERWHVRRPPEIRVTTGGAATCVVTVRCVHALRGEPPEEAQELVRFESGNAVGSLGDLDLAEGDYRLLLQELDRRGEPTVTLTSTTVRLRSADAPLAGGAPADLDHDLGAGARFAVSARPREGDATPRCVGARLRGDIAALAPQQVELPPEELFARGADPDADDFEALPSDRQRSSVTAGSCVITGAHYWKLETVRTARPTKKHSHGVCAYCGLENYYPTGGAPKDQPRKLSGAQVARTGQVPESRVSADVSPVARDDVDADLLLDALAAMRGGSWQAFVRLALQIDDTPWFPHEIAWTLSALGHLDLELGEDGRPCRWMIAPATLVESYEGDYVLAGKRSASLLDRLRERVSQRGGEVRVEPQTQAPARLAVTGLSRQEIDTVRLEVSEAVDIELSVERDVGRRLVAQLPSLETLRQDLPRWGVGVDQRVERLDLRSGRWEAGYVQATGAYRLQRRPNVYAAARITVDGVDARLCDSRLVRHLAAADQAISLVAYTRDRRRLIVPRGGELPGLYGRAAALCSGRAPVQRHDWTVAYPSIPPDVAGEIGARLQHTPYEKEHG